MIDFKSSPISRARLTALIEDGPSHLVPIWRAVRDYGVMFALAQQGQNRFSLPVVRPPTITLISDDVEAALGPDGFHRRSLSAIASTLTAAVIVSGAPLPKLYWVGATAAVIHRRHVAIIETRPEQELPWIAFLLAERPGLHLLVGTVQGGTA